MRSLSHVWLCLCMSLCLSGAALTLCSSRFRFAAFLRASIDSLFESLQKRGRIRGEGRVWEVRKMNGSESRSAHEILHAACTSCTWNAEKCLTLWHQRSFAASIDEDDDDPLINLRLRTFHPLYSFYPKSNGTGRGLQPHQTNRSPFPPFCSHAGCSEPDTRHVQTWARRRFSFKQHQQQQHVLIKFDPGFRDLEGEKSSTTATSGKVDCLCSSAWSERQEPQSLSTSRENGEFSY